MNRSSVLIVASAAAILTSALPAYGGDLGLEFEAASEFGVGTGGLAADAPKGDLPQEEANETRSPLSSPSVSSLSSPLVSPLNSPLSIPASARQVPSRSKAGDGGDLPPPPTLPSSSLPPLEKRDRPTFPVSAKPPTASPVLTADAAQVSQPTVPLAETDRTVALSFDLPPVDDSSNPASPSGDKLGDGLSDRPPAPGADSSQLPLEAAPSSLEALFSGETDSLVAIAVGSAEGTRTPTGDRTSIYGGHTDPGNGVWNLGTFSYQHGARSPEEADLKQLQRLKQQAQLLQAQAAQQQMTLTVEAALNGIDLANQAPAAALERGGYIDRLRQADDMGLKGAEAILWARVRSYLDPDTQQWNAPGLGNTLDRITHDQNRRMNEIARAIAVYQQRQGGVVAQQQQEQAIARLFAQATPATQPNSEDRNSVDRNSVDRNDWDRNDSEGDDESWIERLFTLDLTHH
ncbi:MAG TPA: hypothetical protein V6C88_09095 [Chroococcidiopsis sp.]